ncbi:MAG: c-type cytochrome, partial [bacterium]
QFVSICLAQSRLTVEQLIDDLGCPSCHSGLSIVSDIRKKPPELSHAGLRYNPAYLFNFLQNPTRVRHNIGLSRMPNFHLSEKESLALVLFLETQVYIDEKWPEFPSQLPRRKFKELDNSTKMRVKTVMEDRLECTKCHALEGKGDNMTTDLTPLGYRVNRDWLQTYLVAPYIFDGLETNCPSYFYQVASKQSEFVETYPQAPQLITDMVDYFFTISKNQRMQLQATFEKAKKSYPEVNAGMGEKIFLSLNCTACHDHVSIKPWQKYIAPNLSMEGERVKKEWLVAFLKKPEPIRPFGFYPGSGSRMPDFRLADEEVDLLSEFLLKQKQVKSANKQPFAVKKLSAFAMAKAQTLLQRKLSCLGCHQLGQEGGKIGPNLSNLQSRLQPDFVFNYIQNPKEILPETIMPKIVMPPKNLELIVNYLLQQKIPKEDSLYLSLMDNPTHYYRGEGQKFSLYLKYCASCHGRDGDGKGYNAKYLPTQPTNHADAIYMSKRPDDTLYDGIFAGGYILNKSHFMPPWGHTLKHAEIRQLVGHLRDFCQCAGPEWSTDNQ